MKSTTLLAIAASVASVAIADPLKYGAPIASTVWTAGGDGTISWTNNCSDLTNTTFPIILQTQRADGVQTPVPGVASLGNLNCASAGSMTVKVPSVPTGNLYSILVQWPVNATASELSYSALFTINGSASTTATPSATASATASVSGTPTSKTTAATTASPSTKPNGAGALKAGSAAALAVAGAVAALIF
ncbi:hypothetical protein FBU30_005082 [Linnemannia zychae]|nr:hypothetical protein FBU30_005082 [Linnemannia zychae]